MTETIRIWHAACSSTEAGRNERRCEAWLTEAERRGADRFRQPTSRNQHVIGRGMARRLLADRPLQDDLAVSPESILFDAETWGKPFVVSPEAACRPFNVAHTDGLVVCGIGDSRESLLGVDVECLRRRTDPGLADRYFSVPEVAYLKSHRSEEARQVAFLRIWTLKEAFIKAIGTGLQTPLADFAFEDIDSDRPSIRMLSPQLESDRRWQFFSITPRPGFIGAIAVAYHDDAPEPVYSMHEFEDLIDS